MNDAPDSRLETSPRQLPYGDFQGLTFLKINGAWPNL